MELPALILITIPEFSFGAEKSHGNPRSRIFDGIRNENFPNTKRYL
jgi:hypothetical protein